VSMPTRILETLCLGGLETIARNGAMPILRCAGADRRKSVELPDLDYVSDRGHRDRLPRIRWDRLHTSLAERSQQEPSKNRCDRRKCFHGQLLVVTPLQTRQNPKGSGACQATPTLSQTPHVAVCSRRT